MNHYLPLVPYTGDPVYRTEFVMHGSHGSIRFDAQGNVLNPGWCNCGDCENGYDVARVDVEELRAFYAAHWSLDEFNVAEFDVLEVGWWCKDGTYCPAVPEARLDILNRVRDGHDI